MNNEPEAVIAIKEERVIIGGVEMTKKTAIAAAGSYRARVSLTDCVYWLCSAVQGDQNSMK